MVVRVLKWWVGECKSNLRKNYFYLHFHVFGFGFVSHNTSRDLILESKQQNQLNSI